MELLRTLGIDEEELSSNVLAFLLLLGSVGSAVWIVLSVSWVPEDDVVPWSAILGLCLSVLLAKRPLKPLYAWVLLTLYGLLIVFITLARLWPPIEVLVNSQSSIRLYWLQNGALFVDRFGGWLRAMFSGGRSQETIVFAFGLGLLSWFLSAYAGWSTFRQQKPLLGLTLMGLAITINMYFGSVPPVWSALFVGFVAVLTAVLQYISLEQQWEAEAIDYSESVRTDLALYATLISVLLIGLAFLLPGIPFTRIASSFANQPAIQQAEERLNDVFGGVNQPGSGRLASGGQGRGGTLPREFLIGNPPELYETVMMQAEVFTVTGNGETEPAANELLRGAHWRTMSYDIYTGSGWAISDERTEPVAAFEALPLPQLSAQQTLYQQVNWQHDKRLTRYTIGLPQKFDEDVTSFWHGLNDLVRVQGQNQQYAATSLLSTATAMDLRKTAVNEIPPTILNRYTTLPDSVPQRIHDLAEEIGADLANPYDQALAIENFLRQYPYSLEVTLPSGNQDPVDYFLFDLQVGYCDYYASSMVVLARSLGLPARLGTGYLSQLPDDNGMQTIYQINGHSWAEIYFAGYGWIEFEPTAVFPTTQGQTPEGVEAVENSPFPVNDPPSIPTPRLNPSRLGGRLLFVSAFALVIGYLFLHRWAYQVNSVSDIYHRLHTWATAVGFDPFPGLTPYEFETELQDFLKRNFEDSKKGNSTNQIHSAISIIIDSYVKKTYSPHATPFLKDEQLVRNWEQIKPHLWYIQLIHLLRRLHQRKS